MKLSTSRAKFRCAEDKNGSVSIPQTLSIEVSNFTIYGGNCKAQYFPQTAQNMAKVFCWLEVKAKYFVDLAVSEDESFSILTDIE